MFADEASVVVGRSMFADLIANPLIADKPLYD
jgi:hypothetical protein